jgi:thiamine-phosphate pyrophosphorylase
MFVLITSEHFIKDEFKFLNKFLEHDVYIHIRKPFAYTVQISNLLNSISPEFYPKISMHNHYEILNNYLLGGIHLSAFNRPSIESRLSQMPYVLKNLRISYSLHENDKNVSLKFFPHYVFISPVWNSISKPGYEGKNLSPEEFNLNPQTLKIALGGIKTENVEQTFLRGYDGIAVCGYVWNSLNPFKKFEKIYNEYLKCKTAVLK